MKTKALPLLLALSMLFMFVGCGSGQDVPAADAPDAENTPAPAPETPALSDGGAGESSDAQPEKDEYLGGDFEEITLSSKPAVSLALMPEASGTVVYKNEKATVDASHTEDGYVMVAYTESTDSRIKVIIQGPSTKYTYNLAADGQYEVFPLSDGSGRYNVYVYKNISGTSYALAYGTGFEVSLKNEFAPFLLPNQYVNYSPESAVVAKAAELTADSTGTLDSIADIYNFVVGTFSYDYERAATVKSGYLPDLDDVLAKQKGICFDYAAVMTAMLRSLGIPCKLVIGNAGNLYHAWISCYSEDSGWLDGIIYFDGYEWKLLDPTFASTGGSSDSVKQFIADSSNYVARYLY